MGIKTLNHLNALRKPLIFGVFMPVLAVLARHMAVSRAKKPVAGSEARFRKAQPLRALPSVEEFTRPPHCNTPLRHPAFEHMTISEKRVLWRDLARNFRARGLAENLKQKIRNEQAEKFASFLPQMPEAERTRLWEGKILNEARSIIHVWRISHAIPLGNFLVDLPFDQRSVMLDVAIPILFDHDDHFDRTQKPKVETDHFHPDYDLHYVQREFFEAWQEAQREQSAFVNGSLITHGMRVRLDSLYDAIHNPSWEGDAANRSGPEWDFIRRVDAPSDAYLEGVLVGGEKINWISSWDPEMLYSLLARQPRLRRLIFGVYENDTFTQRMVVRRFF